MGGLAVRSEFTSASFDSSELPTVSDFLAGKAFQPCMPYPRFALLTLATVLLLPLVLAQDVPPSPSPWTPPPLLNSLAADASFHTEFTFNPQMLQRMGQALPDPDKPIVAKLRGITLDTYRFSAPGMYDPAVLHAVREQYAAAGWTHITSNQRRPVPPPPPPGDEAAQQQYENAAPPSDPVRTDLFVHMVHNNVEGAVVLLANQKNVNLIYVDAFLSPVDLLHLRGHFGIPDFDSDQIGVPPPQ